MQEKDSGFKIITLKNLLLFLWLTNFFWSLLATANESFITPLAQKSLLLDGAHMNGLTVVVGERGHILRSENQGTHWQQVSTPTQALLTAVHFVNRSIGWAVGHDHVILNTNNAGLTWQLVYENIHAESPLLDVWFETPNHGIAIGAYGTFLETFNGGKSWKTRQISQADLHLNHIAYSSTSANRDLFIVAESGTIYHSKDTGKNWSEIKSPYHGSFFGALTPSSSNNMLLFGLRGHLFRFDQRTKNWEHINSHSKATLNQAIELQDGTIIIVGLAGTILTSRDHGQSFSQYQLPNRQGISSVVQLTNEKLLLLGEFGINIIDKAILMQRSTLKITPEQIDKGYSE